MAYNNGLPVGYPQYMPQQQQFTYPAQMQTQPNQNFISVPSEEVARNYPVGPNNSVMFKDENTPYIYTKFMPPSPFASAVFEKYKLVRESETVQGPQKETNVIDCAAEIKKLWGEVNVLKEQMAKTSNSDKGTEDIGA